MIWVGEILKLVDKSPEDLLNLEILYVNKKNNFLILLQLTRELLIILMIFNLKRNIRSNI